MKKAEIERDNCKSEAKVKQNRFGTQFLLVKIRAVQREGK